MFKGPSAPDSISQLTKLSVPVLLVQVRSWRRAQACSYPAWLCCVGGEHWGTGRQAWSNLRAPRGVCGVVCDVCGVVVCVVWWSGGVVECVVWWCGNVVVRVVGTGRRVFVPMPASCSSRVLSASDLHGRKEGERCKQWQRRPHQ